MSQIDEIERAQSKIRATIALINEIERAANEALTAIESALQGPFNDLANLPSDLPSQPCDHRRNHRPGRPSRIDSNPDLRDFILARIDRMTSTALAKDIAYHFPPEQRVGKSVLHEWFHKNRPKSHPR
ncbi:hypothetical protein [Microbulbifer sp. S227A]|uniref:hypothetical protein n=1 Tax=Microbulbifer sp. S227A TaxID=3415131 RepID=UPI003C7B1F0C